MENSYADELRQAKNSPSAPPGEGEGESASEPSSLRERVMQARRAMDVKEKAKQALQKKVMAPAKQATSQLLKSAWRIMFSVIGFLPGLLYVNIHVFLKMVLGENFFCKLGEEWIPKQAAAAGGEAAKTAGKGIGIIEVMVLLFLDIVVLFVVLLSLMWVALIVAFMSASWLEKLKWIWEAFQLAGIGAFKALLSLF